MTTSMTLTTGTEPKCYVLLSAKPNHGCLPQTLTGLETGEICPSETPVTATLLSHFTAEVRNNICHFQIGAFKRSWEDLHSLLHATVALKSPEK